MAIGPRSLGRIAPGRAAVGAAAVGLGLIGAVFAVQLVLELATAPAVGGHHDLLAFWAAGRLILDGRPGELYDAAAVTALQRTVIPVPIGMNGYMPFINPPLAAALFAPLSGLGEPDARWLWAGLNALLLAAAAGWIARSLPRSERLVAAFLVATSYPAIHALAEGQWSIVILAAGLGALEAARRGRWLLAGIALVPFWIKPQLIVLPLLGLVLARRPSGLAGAIGGGAVLAAVAMPFTGLAAYGTYLSFLAAVVTSHFSGAGAAAAATWQGDLATTEGINGILVGWFGQGAVGLVNVAWAGIVLLGLAGYALAARRTPPGLGTAASRTMFTAAIAIGLLANPNQFVQDCILAFLALDALAPLGTARRFPAIVAAVGLADLTAIDLRLPALHAFAIALVLLVAWACVRAVRQEAGPAGRDDAANPPSGPEEAADPGRPSGAAVRAR